MIILGVFCIIVLISLLIYIRQRKSRLSHYYAFFAYAEDEIDDIMIYAAYKNKLTDTELETEKRHIVSKINTIKVVDSAAIYLGIRNDYKKG